MIAETSRIASTDTISPEHGSAVLIRKAAVLGAGTMGSRIAAHLANAGLPVVLLDIPAQGRGAQRDRRAGARGPQEEQARGIFRRRRCAARITVGNFDDDLALLADCDWVIEAVTENLAIKQALLEKVAPHLKPDAILTTNTSGLPIASIAAETAGSSLRRRWFGTHFFNPPRYMRLVEIIPTPEADPAAIAAVAHFADLRLGKEVVFARDTPNFIANRIGVFIMLEAVRLMQERRPHHRRGGCADRHGDRLAAHRDLPPGRPGGHRRAGARGRELRAARASAAERSACRRSSRRCWSAAGSATRPGRASTRRRRTPRAKKSASCSTGRRWSTIRPPGPSCPSLEMAKNAERLPERLRQLLAGDVQQGQGRALPLAPAERACGTTRRIACRRSPTTPPASTAPCAPGFNWEMGPFQLWDAAGVPAHGGAHEGRGRAA